MLRSAYRSTFFARGAWRRFQDRQLQKELLVAFRFGDGGGGPTIEMIEAGRRLKDLPGFPRVEMGRAREFFERLEAGLAGVRSRGKAEPGDKTMVDALSPAIAALDAAAAGGANAHDALEAARAPRIARCRRPAKPLRTAASIVTTT